VLQDEEQQKKVGMTEQQEDPEEEKVDDIQVPEEDLQMNQMRETA